MVRVKAVLSGLCLAMGILSHTAPSVQAATLLHEYLFDAPGAIDSVGGANGTLFGGATVGGGVLSLDGVDDYVEFGAKLVPTGLTAFSVTLDAQQLSRTPGVFVEMISQGSSGAGGFYIGHDTVGNLRFGDQHTGTGLFFPTDNLFHSYALTSDALGTNFWARISTSTAR